MEILSSFGVHWTTIIAQIVNYAILLYILSRFVYKPLMKSIDEREAKIKKISDDGLSVDKILSDARDKQNEILRQAREESQKIIHEAEASAIVLKNNLIEEAKRDADRLIVSGRKELADEQIRFQESMKNELVDLVSSGVESTVGKYITKDVEAKIKSETLKTSGHKK